MSTGVRCTVSLVTVCVVSALAPGAALAGTLDQQQSTVDNGGLYAHSAQSVAETFTAGLSGTLDQVDLHLQTYNSPTSPLSVELRDVSGGVPGNTVLASQSVPASSVPAAPAGAFVSINFPAPASVAAGTQYAIVAYGTSVYPIAYSWSEGLGNPYAAGVEYYASSAPPTTAWTPDSTVDFAFKTYVATPTPQAPPSQNPTGQRGAALKKCNKKHSARKRRKCRKKANRLPV